MGVRSVHGVRVLGFERQACSNKMVGRWIEGFLFGGCRNQSTHWMGVSVQFSRSVVSDSLRPHGLRYARLTTPMPTPRACSNSCASSQRCHFTISSSVIPFSSCLQSFPASGYFPTSQFFTSGGRSIGTSASAPMPELISCMID